MILLTKVTIKLNLCITIFFIVYLDVTELSVVVWQTRFRYSFVCQGTLTSRQQRDLFGLWVKLPLVTTSLTTPW